MQHAIKLGDTEHPVALSRRPGGYRLHAGVATHDVALTAQTDGRAVLTLGNRQLDLVIASHGDDCFVHLDGEVYELRYRHPLDRLAASSAGSTEDAVLAPMPGSIVVVQIAAGDAVTKGQLLLVMESMKMETSIVAPRDGVVAAVNVEKGQIFDRDAILLVLAPTEAQS